MMLNNYKDMQPIAYNLFDNQIKNNQIGHAYLVVQNNCSYAFNFVMAFVKEILARDVLEEKKEVLFKRIDDGNYPEIKIIEPDGVLIKKKQITDLQDDFSLSAVEGNIRIYIIKDADMMLSQTANSMLKFLEEPTNNIVAILMTNNFNKLLPTIVSRCQVINLNSDTLECLSTDSEIVFNFIKCLEGDKLSGIINVSDVLYSNISVKDRDKMISFFDKVINVYYDILKIKSTGNIISDELKRISEFVGNNTIENLIFKINKLIEVKDAIKNNVNVSLLVDSLILEFGGKI